MDHNVGAKRKSVQIEFEIPVTLVACDAKLLLVIMSV